MKSEDQASGTLGAGNKIDVHHIFFALLCGVLLFLSFPKFGMGFLAWIAFVPLFIALQNITAIRQAMVLGFISGVTAYIGIFYWVQHVVCHYGQLPLYLGFLLVLLLAAYLSVYVALFAAGVVFLRRKYSVYLTAPILWICLEYLKTHLLTGVPWENLGYSQYQNIFLIQMTDITGVHGLSFLVMLLNATIYEILTERSKKTWAVAAAVILLWIGVYAYGAIRINQVGKIQRDAPGMSVSLIQGNISQSIKFNEKFQKDTIDIYEELSRKHATSGGLLIWPETAIPFNYQDENDLRRQVRDVARKTESWFIFGSMSYESKGKYKDYFNSAYLLSPDGATRGKYDKVHLVPYGEYVPLRNYFPFITALAADIGDFATGNGFHPLNMAGRKVGVLICYEGVLSEAGRSYKNESAELLVNITNDAWFDGTSAPYQHLSIAIFRAVETRLYLVRAANTGISAIVDPTGRILKQTELFKKGGISDSIKFIKMQTVYARCGDWIVWAGFAAAIFFFLTSLPGRQKHDH